MAENRILTNELLDEDKLQNIRPETLEEYIGQSEVKENIRVFIKSKRFRVFSSSVSLLPNEERIFSVSSKISYNSYTTLFILSFNLPSSFEKSLYFKSEVETFESVVT